MLVSAEEMNRVMAFETEFNLLLRSFDQDPSMFSKALGSYSASNPEAFLVHARKALLTVPPCRALKCVTSLLTLEGLLQFLLEEYVRSRDSAITLAKKILQSEPRFDATLIEYVEDKGLADRSELTVLAALDMLDEISERDRLVLNILAFVKHPNPKLCSKATRMLGRRRPNATCIDALLRESDLRVRANAWKVCSGSETTTHATCSGCCQRIGTTGSRAMRGWGCIWPETQIRSA